MTTWQPPSQEELAQRFGQVVRAERQRRGWSQQETAKRLDMTSPYLCQLEAGGLNVTLGTLARFAAVFRLPAHWFLCPPEHPLRDVLREPPPFEGSERLRELATLGRRMVEGAAAPGNDAPSPPRSPSAR